MTTSGGVARVDETSEKFELYKKSIQGISIVCYILASWVPLRAMRPMVHDLAGKNTQVNAALTISLAFSAFVTVAWGLTALKSRERKGKVEKQRVAINKLQHELALAASARTQRELP